MSAADMERERSAFRVCVALGLFVQAIAFVRHLQGDRRGAWEA